MREIEGNGFLLPFSIDCTCAKSVRDKVCQGGGWGGGWEGWGGGERERVQRDRLKDTEQQEVCTTSSLCLCLEVPLKEREGDSVL